MPKEKTLQSFSGFTNLYEVQKTLRFELRPVGKTAELLKQNQVFEKDKLIDDNYHKIKYYFDLLHRSFIKETLSDVKFVFGEYYKELLALKLAVKKDDKISKTEFKNEEKKLREQLVESFNQKAKEWRKKYKQKGIELKKDDFEILFEKDNLEILKEEFKNKPDDDKDAPDIEFIDPITKEQKNLFESFKGFTTYFGNFYNSRRNFYGSEEKDTAVANRAINENLRIFCDNITKYKDYPTEFLELLSDADKKIEKKIFDLNYYNNCLLQEGIDAYNEVVGEINKNINPFKQQNKDSKINNPGFLKILYKQILGKSDKEARFVEITSDEQFFDVLREFIILNDKKNIKAKQLFDDFLLNQNNYELDKIYLKKASINTIFGKFFGANEQYFENALPKKETDRKEEKYKLDDFISIQTIKDALLGIQKDKKDLPKKYQYLGKIEMSPKDLFKEEYAKELADDNYQSFLNIWKSEFEKCLNECKIAKEQIEKIVTNEKKYKKSDTQIEKIKAYADASSAIYQMMKCFVLEKGRKKVVDLETDNNFYNDFSEYYNDYRHRDYYDEFRNYLTKKPFSEEKIKLNFENGQALKGWDMNKEPEYFGSILKNEGEYFLAIFHKSHSDEIFRRKNKNSTIRIEEAYNISDEKCYEKVELKQIPKLFMNLPRICFAKGNEKEFGLTNELKQIKREFDLFQKDKKDRQDKEAKFNQDKFIKLLTYYRHCLETRNDWKVFKYNFSPLEQYKNLGEFYRDLEKGTYHFDLAKVNYEYVAKKNDEGKIYLFKIYNKDFSEQSLGNKNLHSLYFKALFSDKNLKEKKITLAADAKVFFRNKTEKEKLETKKDNKGKEVIDHKRYADDKIIFHLPIVLNFAEHDEKINQRVLNEFVFKENDKLNENINIIGIDRGENNLAYYSVIDQNGKILESQSLNTIDVLDKDGKVIKPPVDYLKLLKEKAGKRDEQRKNWKTIENIKELKNGYISQVVRKICDLILKYNAIIVFEDLSGEFKRIRMKIEEQIYQKLELALVKKLNYLVNKNTKENETGHYLKAYQLTPPIVNYGDVGKQTGIIFYTQANYTSKTCPQCGFRKNVRFDFENKTKSEEVIKKLKNFVYEPQNNRFKIEYRLSDFIGKKKKGRQDRENILFRDEKGKDDFVVNSNVIRYKWHDKTTKSAKIINRGEEKVPDSETKRGIVKKYDINECLLGLFERNGIDYKENNLQDAIIRKGSVELYKDLFYYLFLLLNIRSTVSDINIDYIQCPSCGFHSDKPPKALEMIKNGDANGAYNIARKGIMILEKIKQFKEKNGSLNKMGWGDVVIGIEEWDKFVQK